MIFYLMKAYFYYVKKTIKNKTFKYNLRWSSKINPNKWSNISMWFTKIIKYVLDYLHFRKCSQVIKTIFKLNKNNYNNNYKQILD